MYNEWSLNTLYSGFDDETFQEDLKKTESFCETCHQFADSLGNKEEKETLIRALRLMEEHHLLMEKLMIFCNLKQAADTSDSASLSYMGRLMQKLSDVQKPFTRIRRFIAEIPNLDALIDTDSFLNEYKDYLHCIQKAAKHTLNEETEEALARMNVSGGQAWSDLHGCLTSSVEVLYQGEKTTLSSIRNMAYSPDAQTRKEAYHAELACYEKIKDSVAYALNSIKLQDISESSMRGFASPLDRVLFHSRMERATLEALLEAMKEYLPNFHSYLRQKATALGHTNGLPWYDLFAPMGNSNKQYTVEEAKSCLLHVFENCNPAMANITNRAFEEHWIDFFPRNGKVGGAFCQGLIAQKQFRILTNFGGTFGDVLTLAHELGHGYHDFMIFDNRPLNTNYSMPVAETASTFNENLMLNFALEQSNDDQEKLALIEQQLSDTTQIICDIYSRFLFESRVVEKRSENFMSAEELCQIMREAQKEAYGSGLDPEFLHPYMWICKVHYYSADLSFYNFPYAFGGLFARGLYEKYKQEGSSFLQKYNLMLQQTPVCSVEDAAKICGIDLTSKDFWLMSLHSFDSLIEEFKRLTSN